jgi:hypothetical protein
VAYKPACRRAKGKKKSFKNVSFTNYGFKRFFFNINIKTQELEQPTQKDFESQAVYIIDCFYAIFVWVGSNASQYGYQLAIKTAHNLEQRKRIRQ